MSGILTSMPWHCGDRSCPVGWHLGNYWLNEDDDEVAEGLPYTYDEFGDGDHSPVESIPTCEEYDKAVRDYEQHVAAEGKDPIGWFVAGKATRKITTKWQVTFGESTSVVSGTFVIGARINGRGPWLKPDALPEHLSTFLLMEPKGPMPEFQSLAHLREEAVEVTWQAGHPAKGLIKIEHTVQRKPSAVQRELVAAAEASLRRKSRLKDLLR